MTTLPIPAIRDQFLLRKDITFLNFGSFGACPESIFNDYIRWQRLLEEEPVQFIAFNGAAYMKKSREALATYAGCDTDEIVYTPNPTYAINIIAKSLGFSEGDEVLSTDLEYGAMDRTWNFYCGKSGAKFIRQPIRFPIESKQDFIDQFWKGYSERTKVVFISHITSATALILPVREICAEAKKRGLITIVDGAHVPGHIPLDLRKLEVDFYTGACHKWMMTPKGSSFLFASKKMQSILEPLIVSWGYESEKPSGSTFTDHHEFTGTRDFSAYLTIPKAIEFMKENNWENVAASCRKIVTENANRFCELSGNDPVAPVSEDFLGQMFSIPVQLSDPAGFQKMLFEKHKIEIPVTRRGSDFFIRYSIQAFNDQKDLDRLFEVLEKEL
jgi:isopenicillin-N epimerase